MLYCPSHCFSSQSTSTSYSRCMNFCHASIWKYSWKQTCKAVESHNYICSELKSRTINSGHCPAIGVTTSCCYVDSYWQSCCVPGTHAAAVFRHACNTVHSSSAGVREGWGWGRPGIMLAHPASSTCMVTAKHVQPTWRMSVRCRGCPCAARPQAMMSSCVIPLTVSDNSLNRSFVTMSHVS